MVRFKDCSGISAAKPLCDLRSGQFAGELFERRNVFFRPNFVPHGPSSVVRVSSLTQFSQLPASIFAFGAGPLERSALGRRRFLTKMIAVTPALAKVVRLSRSHRMLLFPASAVDWSFADLA